MTATEPSTSGCYGQARPDLVAAPPRPLGRVPDVGYGEGGVGRGLRAAGADWLSGIELQPGAADRARGPFDLVDTDQGDLDRTYVRWFTDLDIDAVVEHAGWRVESVAHPELGRARRLARWTRGASTQFLTAQWYLPARA